jgi:hypothetical protein
LKLLQNPAFPLPQRYVPIFEVIYALITHQAKQELTSVDKLAMSPSASSTQISLPGKHVESGENNFPESARIAVAVCTTIAGVTVLAIGGYCLYRKRKRSRSRNSGAEEKMLPIASPFQSATRYPMALTTQDREEWMLQSVMKYPIALPTMDREETQYESAMKHPLALDKHDLQQPKPYQSSSACALIPSKPSHEEPKPYQSPTAFSLARSPLECPVVLDTHELEQPPAELDTPVLRRRPSELDGRMIYPSEMEDYPGETSGARRARTARDELGSEHWTFLRESSATDFLD